MALQLRQTDFLNIAAVEAKLNDVLHTRSPFSMIRIGDGEGMALAGHGGKDDPMRTSAVAAFGDRYTQKRAEWMRSALSLSIHNATLIGLRFEVFDLRMKDQDFALPQSDFVDLFNTQTRQAEVQNTNPGYQAALRLAHMVRELEKIDLSGQKDATHAWMHLELLKSGALAKLVKDAPRLGLITCRRNLVQHIRKARGNRPTIFLPSLDVFGAEAKLGVSPEFWWRSMVAIDNSLVGIRPGDVYLVGAGIWGKVFCEKVRQGGGIAIDIGSAWDAWAGLHSRPGVMYHLFAGIDNAPLGEVPKSILLESQLKKFVYGTR